MRWGRWLRRRVRRLWGIAVMLSNLPTLGVGLGFREPFRADLFLHRRHVDFLEITADHYLDASPEKEQELDLLAGHFTLHFPIRCVKD